MLKIYDIREKQEYLREVLSLECLEWGSKSNNQEEFELKIDKKIDKIVNDFDNPYFCKLILLDDDKLLGFISIFESDGEEYKHLKPWYATMYVKKEYRGKGYSKILNNAILREAKNRGFNKLYLKSDLENYYEKFGAVYLDKLKNGEKLYYINVD